MPRGVRAGVAYVDIYPRLAAFQAALGTGLNRIAKRMDTVGTRLTKSLALPLAAIGGASVKLAVDFETTMSRITGLVGLAADEVELLGEQVLALAPKVGKGPRELAEALYFITSSGIPANKAMEVLEASARAATAGLGDTAVVADAVTSALNAYRTSGLTAAQATDILAATVREGKGEASELAGVIGRVIPVASEVGVEFDEVGAAIASMTLTGLDAAEAVTALRGFFTLLLKPAKQSRAALKEMGLTATDVAAITGRLNVSLLKGGLSVEKLREIVAERGLFEGMVALKGAIGDNRDALGDIIPNVRALTGFLSITGQNAEQNAEIFRELSDATGATDAAFAAASETAQVKWNKALASLQSAGIKLGNLLLPVVKDMADFVGRLADRFSKLSPGVQEAVAKTLLFLVVLGPTIKLAASLIRTILLLVDGLLAVAKAILFLRRAFIGLRIFLAGRGFSLAFLGPWVALAAAVAVVVVLLIKFRKQFVAGLKRIAQFFVRVWEGIRDFFVDLWQDLVRGWNRIWDAIRGPVKVITKVIATAIKVWVTIFKVQFAVLRTAVRAALAPIIFTFRVFFAALVGVVRVALIPIVAAFGLAFLAIKAIIQVAAAAWRGIIAPALNAIAAVVKFVWNNVIVPIVRVAASVIGAVIRFYAGVWKTIFVTAWNAIAAVVRAVWGVIKATVVPAVQFVARVIGKTIGFIRDNWKRVWEGLKSTVKTVWDGISGVVRTAVNVIIGIIETFLNTLTAVPRKLGGLLSKVPGLGGLKDLSKSIKLPRLDVGGTVEATGAAIVHRGEVVLNEGMQAAVAGGAAAQINLYPRALLGTKREVMEWIREALLELKRHNARAGLA